MRFIGEQISGQFLPNHVKGRLPERSSKIKGVGRGEWIPHQTELVSSWLYQESMVNDQLFLDRFSA